jgi:hypothetical protein
MRHGLALLLVLSCGIALAGESRQTPVVLTLDVERAGDVYRLWARVDTSRGTERVLLRESVAEIRPGRSGGDPAGRAVFATWTEAPDAAWSTFSRDGGTTWVEARPLDATLHLRAGHAPPGTPVPLPDPGLALGPAGRVFLVQFRTVSLPEWRSTVTGLGVEILSFFPRNAHLVRLPVADDASVLSRIAALDFVQRVEPYHPSYRLEPALRDWLADPGLEPAERHVRVQAFEWGPSGKRRIAAAALSAGAEVAEFWPSGHVIELVVDRDQLRAVAAHDDVLWIERWTDSGHDMDLVREDAGTDFVEAGFGYCGTGVRGEVLDIGIQEDHPDFDGLLLHGGNAIDAHGTSTYGIVFGNGDRDGDGDAQATGHLPCHEQGIAADKDFLGDRFLHTQELLSPPYEASFQSNSWGSARDYNYTIKANEMDDIIWRLDLPITQSQSNAGTQASRPQAWAKNVISVGGIKHMDTLSTADDEWCLSGGGCASIGPAADGRIKPDLHYWYDSIYTTTSGSGYRPDFGGTSAATPEVAGVLGLILEMWADNVWGTNPSGTSVFEKAPHFSTTKALLINSARQYTFSGTAHDLTRMHQGWGRPSARVALERAATSLIVDEDEVLALRAPVAYDVTVPVGESELRVTMVYPDPPGITSATLHRVNDVDLTVTSPSGEVYHGNAGLDVDNYSTPGGAPDGLNTVENVFVQNPQPGTWKVEIEAIEINQDSHTETPDDDVDFALVVTGASGAACVKPVVDFTISPNPARVGETVLLDATAGGGAGGPFTYAWDFDDDGSTDDTREDPGTVYTLPYEGFVKLTARDGGACPETLRKAISVTGPDVRFEDVFELVEVEGNGNGGLDPGEVWDMRLTLRNDGNEDAVGLSAEIAIDPSTPGSMLVQQALATYPTIAPAGTAAGNDLYRFSIGHDFPCGQEAVFGLTHITTTDPANTYPDQLGVIRVLVGGSGPPLQFHFDGFETNTGWSDQGNGEWEIDAPQGLGGQSSIPGQTAKPDPSTAFEGSFVLGNDLTGQGALSGNYENGVTTTVTSPPIDASEATDVELRVARWLNTEVNDASYLEISVDWGVNWTRLFDDPGDFTEQSWSQNSWDISSIADLEPVLQLRFGLISDAAGVQGGWNIDAVELMGVIPESCEPFAPSGLGQIVGLTVDKAGAGTLQLDWVPDCAGGTRYGIYRGDLTAGYASIVPEPGKCAVVGTSDTVPEGAGSADFFLVVPNDGGQEGFYGTDSTGTQRTPAAAPCFGQSSPANCVP